MNKSDWSKGDWTFVIVMAIIFPPSLIVTVTCLILSQTRKK